MTPQELENLRDAIGHWVEEHAWFLIGWLLWAFVAFFAVGPATEINTRGPMWLVPTFGAMLLPLVLVVVNVAVLAFRRNTRRHLRRQRDAARIAELEHELEIR